MEFSYFLAVPHSHSIEAHFTKNFNTSFRLLRIKCLPCDILIGRGVFATQPIEPGDFVLEYRGELLTQEECQSRLYSEIESTFLFDFEWENRCFW